jgi:hypothetical protein
VEGGVEVSIEVHLDLKDSEEECPACRLPMLIDSLSVSDLLSSLRHSTVGTSSRSCMSPHSHCRSSSPNTMLPKALSEAFGVSLSEVLE